MSGRAQCIGPPGVGVVLQDAMATHKIITSAQTSIHEEMSLISVFLADKFIFELHTHHNHNLAMTLTLFLSEVCRSNTTDLGNFLRATNGLPCM
jgi:hypothetical protein